MRIEDVQTRRLVNEFPNKIWSRRDLEDFLHRLRAIGTPISEEIASGKGEERERERERERFICQVSQ